MTLGRNCIVTVDPYHGLEVCVCVQLDEIPVIDLERKIIRYVSYNSLER